MSTHERIMTICSDTPNPGIPFQKAKCVQCEKSIVISLSTIERAMEISENAELVPYCLSCGMKYREENEVPTLPFSEKQIKEILRGITK